MYPLRHGIVPRFFPFLALFLLLTVGCAVRYTTPGAGVNISLIGDEDIKERFETKPAVSFPASIAVVRIQQSGYQSYGNEGYGSGNFSVVTTRDVETDAQFDQLSSLPEVAGITTLNRLLIPPTLNSVKDLRQGAASLHTDLLWLYTIDTSFRIMGKSYGPLTTITLGFLPNKEAIVTTTASGVLFDVRTGYVYGLSEATSSTSQMASIWSQSQAVENSRLKTEKEAFSKLLEQFKATWAGVIKEYRK